MGSFGSSLRQELGLLSQTLHRRLPTELAQLGEDEHPALAVDLDEGLTGLRWQLGVLRGRQ